MEERKSKYKKEKKKRYLSNEALDEHSDPWLLIKM